MQGAAINILMEHPVSTDLTPLSLENSRSTIELRMHLAGRVPIVVVLRDCRDSKSFCHKASSVDKISDNLHIPIFQLWE